MNSTIESRASAPFLAAQKAIHARFGLTGSQVRAKRSAVLWGLANDFVQEQVSELACRDLKKAERLRKHLLANGGVS